jgi:AcrR family transcriptional regulator
VQTLPEGLRARKKRVTRERIQEVGLRLMAERGYDAVSVDDIAANADVAPRTFYRYFASKDDLILGPQDDYLAILREAIAEYGAEGASLSTVLDAMCELAHAFEEASDDVRRRISLIMAHPALLRKGFELHREWSEAVQEQLVKTDTSLNPMCASAMAGTGVAIFWAAVGAWVESEGTTPLTELTEQTAREFLAVAQNAPPLSRRNAEAATSAV